MRRRFDINYFRFAVIALCCNIAGCDSKDSRPALPPIIYGTGTLDGTVHFIGTPPVMRMIPNRPCHAGAQPFSEETVVVGPDGGFANVFVSIEGVPAGDGSALPPTTLDQKDCRFQPHAIGVAVGQTLTIRSDDPTMHNVTYAPSNNPPKNFSMVEAGTQMTTTFVAPEYIRVRCDVHPWMNGWIGVFNHPFFAVTDAGGAFHINRVPPGNYTLVAWQEQYGKIEQPVTIAADQTVKVDVNFKSP